MFQNCIKLGDQENR